jgi:hypothetical protein
MKIDDPKLITGLKLFVPLIVIIILFASAVGFGIVTIGPFNTDTKTLQRDGITTTATIIIDYGNGEINSYAVYTENNTVYGFLMEAAKIGGFDVKTTYYSSFDSLLVDTIGDKTGGDDNKYWSYYVNNEYGSIGADKQIVNSGDVIEWKFEGFEW